MEHALAHASFVVTGTGWMTDSEHRARLFASANAIPSAAVVDRPFNVRERFVRRGVQQLPSEFWVVDDSSSEAVAEMAPGIPIIKLENAYEDSVVERVRALSDRGPMGRPGKNVLFLSEPVRGLTKAREEPAEFRALRYLVEHMEQLTCGSTTSLSIRLHPAESPFRYSSIAGELGMDVRVVNQEVEPLEDSLAWADIVAGISSSTMRIAYQSGKRVVCCLPPELAGFVPDEFAYERLSRVVG